MITDCPCGLDAELWRCIDGTVYGPCGSEHCGGVCEHVGACDCDCHPQPERDQRRNPDVTTNENAAAVRIRAFLNSRQGQTDRFAGTDDAPLTLSDLSAVLNQLDAVRHKTIEDAFRWLRDQAPTDLEGATLTVGPGMEMTVYSQWEIVGWLVEQEKLMHRAADAMAGRNAR